MTSIASLLETRATQAQRDAVARMTSAPAMKWVVSKVLSVNFLGQPCEGVVIQIEAPVARIWGVILPDGTFKKPNPGRKTIDGLDLVRYL